MLRARLRVYRSYVHFFLFVGCLTLVSDAAPPEGSPSDGRLQAHLQAGEFGPALALAERLEPAGRDRWMAKIAQAQHGAGSLQASMTTAYGISGDQSRAATFQQLGERGVGEGLGRGGAALADFDSLINLITTTVEPDSWDTLGGPGAIESFPTGVLVDASGFVTRSEVDEVALPGIRARALRDGGNREMFTSSKLRKVSLTRLERHAQMRRAMGKEPDAAMSALAGIYDIKYVFVFPETRDVVIAGPAGAWSSDSESRLVNTETGAPVLRLDDFVVVCRNAFTDTGRFGCAITPTKDNLSAVQGFLAESADRPLRRSRRSRWLDELKSHLGNQEISVFGIDSATRTAQVLVEADHHMKLIGMGLADGTLGVESYLKTVSLGDDGRPPAMDVLRWWFTLNYEGIRASESRDAFEFVGNGVRVQSENELLDERGGRIHTGTSDELNQRFADSFTKHFDALAKKYPVYAELRNVFDWALVAAVIRSERLADRAGWELAHFNDPESYLVEVGTPPTRVGSVINHRELGRKHLVVGISGGVQVDASKLVRIAKVSDENGFLKGMHQQVGPRDVPADVWWWD